MNAAHLHIILVHIPVILVPVGLAIYLFGTLWKNSTARAIALCLFVGASISAGIAFSLGEDAEEIVEDLPGVSERAIEDHEHAADWALRLSVILGILSALQGVMIKRDSSAQVRLTPFIIVIAALASASLGYSAQLGGKIRHPEAFSQAQASGGGESEHEGGREGDDDDDD